jgi:hypothetical protein
LDENNEEVLLNQGLFDKLAATEKVEAEDIAEFEETWQGLTADF